MKWTRLFITVGFFLSFTITDARAGVSLKGTGSYLAAPLCQKWIQEYTNTLPQLRMKYDVKNSSDGVNQWSGRGADFALSDSGLMPPEERHILGHPAFHLPVAIEAVAITYNLPGVPNNLKLSPKVISSIFMGTILKWNDPAIAALNPGIRLPHMEILVLHRQEESTMHDLFPAWLYKTDPKWTLKREKDKSLHWPAGKNIHGNEKIAENLRKSPGYIAAVDYPFAAQNRLPMAAIRNESGAFVAPTAESLEAATSDILALPDDLRVALSSSRAPKAYPICSFLWTLVYQDAYKSSRHHDRAQALVDFLKWVLSDGQKTAAALSYVPLPSKFIPRIQAAVESIKY